MRSELLGPVLAGVGLAATLDEIVLHQLLRWHSLVTDHGLDTAQISDGALHVFGTVTLVLGVILVVRRWNGDVRGTAGGVLIGLGGFNLWDGTVHHKLLDLHQVREGADNLLPYDVAFVGLALLALAAGVLLRRSSTA